MLPRDRKTTRLHLERLEDRITPNTAWSLNGAPLTLNTNNVASVLVSTNSSGSASITKSEVDYFRFTTTSAGFYNMQVQSSFDSMIGLYSQGTSGKLLGYSDRFGAGANTENITIYLEGGKTYFLGITNYKAVPAGNYNWAINPASPIPGSSVSDDKRHVYLQFDGADITYSDLVSWYNNEWQYGTPNDFDSAQNGVHIQAFLASTPLNGSREAIITGIMTQLQTDLSPFGVRVERLAAGAKAVTGVGVTTVFLGVSDLEHGYAHVAADIDVGNNNSTDIAFVYDENWGNVNSEVLAMSDVALHEIGHTYGLFHVNSGTNMETMGLRYSNRNQAYWVNNTGYMNQSFFYREFYGSQDSYQEVARAFGVGSPLPPPAGSPLLNDYLAEERANFQPHETDVEFPVKEVGDDNADTTEITMTISAELPEDAARALQSNQSVYSHTLQSTTVYRAPIAVDAARPIGSDHTSVPLNIEGALSALPTQWLAEFDVVHATNRPTSVRRESVSVQVTQGRQPVINRIQTMPVATLLDMAFMIPETEAEIGNIPARAEDSQVSETGPAWLDDSPQSLAMLTALALVINRDCQWDSGEELERRKRSQPAVR